MMPDVMLAKKQYLILSEIDRIAAEAENRMNAQLQRLLERVLSAVSKKSTMSAYEAQRVIQEIRTYVATFNEDAKKIVTDAQRRTFTRGIKQIDSAVETSGLTIIFPFVSDQYLIAAQNFSANLISGVSQDALTRISNNIRLASLGGLKFEELINRIGTEIHKGSMAQISARAANIARTETRRISNIASYARAQQVVTSYPGSQKMWHTANDARVRSSHRLLEGQSKDIDEDFIVGGYPALYPQHPSLPAKESAECRCFISISVK